MRNFENLILVVWVIVIVAIICTLTPVCAVLIWPWIKMTAGDGKVFAWRPVLIEKRGHWPKLAWLTYVIRTWKQTSREDGHYFYDHVPKDYLG